jgi:hypothetical protein
VKATGRIAASVTKIHIPGVVPGGRPMVMASKMPAAKGTITRKNGYGCQLITAWDNEFDVKNN